MRHSDWTSQEKVTYKQLSEILYQAGSCAALLFKVYYGYFSVNVNSG